MCEGYDNCYGGYGTATTTTTTTAGGYQDALRFDEVVTQNDGGGGLGIPSGVYLPPPPVLDEENEPHNYVKILIFGGALIILNVIGLAVLAHRKRKYKTTRTTMNPLLRKQTVWTECDALKE